MLLPCLLPCLYCLFSCAFLSFCFSIERLYGSSVVFWLFFGGHLTFHIAFVSPLPPVPPPCDVCLSLSVLQSIESIVRFT